MIASRKANRILASVLMVASLAFAGEAGALSSTPDVHVPHTNGTV